MLSALTQPAMARCSKCIRGPPLLGSPKIAYSNFRPSKELFLDFLSNHGPKPRKKRRRVMRSRRGLGMVLHAKDGLPFVMQALDRLIVEVDPVHGDFRGQ